MDPQRHGDLPSHLGHNPLDFPRHRAAVGVAEDDPLGPSRSSFQQGGEGVLRVCLVSIEEVFRIVKHLTIVGFEERDGILDQFQVLLQGNPECVGHVERPALSEQGDVTGMRVHQRPQRGIVFRRIGRAPRRAEGYNFRLFQRHSLDHLEKFDVLGVGARPPALDIVRAQFVQLLRNANLVFHRERDILGLGAIPQRRIVDFDCAHF